MKQSAAAKKPTRDEAICALIREGSLSGAARASGISRSTLYRWLDDTEFRADLEAARQQATDAEIDAMIDLRRRQCVAARDALGVLLGLLSDAKTSAQLRASIALKLIDSAPDAADRLARWSRKRRNTLGPAVEDALLEKPTTRTEALRTGLSD